jgi:predicted LPLAT superfamily acyltransferase
VAHTVKIPKTAVVRCCRYNDLAQLRTWARLGVRVTSAQPLCSAASRGYVDVIRCLLLELGADVNQALPNGRTALYFAAEGGQLAAVRCLAGTPLEHNCNATVISL